MAAPLSKGRAERGSRFEAGGPPHGPRRQRGTPYLTYFWWGGGGCGAVTAPPAFLFEAGLAAALTTELAPAEPLFQLSRFCRRFARFFRRWHRCWRQRSGGGLRRSCCWCANAHASAASVPWRRGFGRPWAGALLACFAAGPSGTPDAPYASDASTQAQHCGWRPGTGGCRPGLLAGASQHKPRGSSIAEAKVPRYHGAGGPVLLLGGTAAAPCQQ
mmetsp:Transcript_59618/g.128066  ORF Transcript_59618/g.128066 Transcript_59618/m.128066 type:complete len:216 (-) Transcript_59618:929-1576(-)